MKSKGPWVEPWGTPDSTNFTSDLALLHFVHRIAQDI